MNHEPNINEILESPIFIQIKEMTESLYNNIINHPVSNEQKHYNHSVKFKFLYEEKYDFNAYVTHRNNTDYLVINTGVMLVLQEYMYAVFARSDLFPEIGDPHKEINRKFISYLMDKNNTYDMRIPKDEERKEIAQLISNFAVRYIIYHELGHLVNGHIFLLHELTNSFKIHMYSADKQDKNRKISPLDRRTLEYDADAFATTRGIHDVMNILINNKQQWPKCIQDDKYKLFELWGFAVHTIFLFFDYIYKTDYSENSFYLPNQARQIANLTSASANIKSFYTHESLRNFNKMEISCEDIQKILMRGCAKAEFYFNFFFHTEFYLSTSFSDTRYNQYVSQIKDNWDKQLKLKMRKYSRAILA